MGSELTWDEAKRRSNLLKHGLDFAQARWVLEARYRLDIAVERRSEIRVHSFAYVFDRLAVLSLVHLPREGTTRIVSFRPASAEESESFYEWIAQDAPDA